MTATDRVVATDSAVELLTKLSELHGGLMIHQSGGCCGGSAPMCYPSGEFRVGQRDVLLGEIELADPIPAVRVWIQGDQYEVWKHTQLILDVVPGRVTIWQAASPHSSQAFILVGASVLIPIILTYTGYAYWVFRGKVDADGYH